MNPLFIRRSLRSVRRRWIPALIVCIIGAIVIVLIAPFLPAYKGTAELLLVSDGTKDTTLTDQTIPNIVTSTAVLDRVIHRLKLPTNSIDLAKAIKTKIATKSAVVQISYRDRTAQLATDVANTVADESVNYYHDIATRGYLDVIKNLVGKIGASKAEVATFDRLLHRLSAANAVASSDNALSDLTMQFDALRAQRNQVAASIAADAALASNLKHQLSTIKSIARGEILERSPEYVQALSGFAKDKANLISERASLTDSFPGIYALAERSRRESGAVAAVGAVAVENGAGLSPTMTKAILDSNAADGNVAADRKRLAEIGSQLIVEQDHLKEVAGASAAVGTLRAEHDAALQKYSTLIGRLAAAQGDAAQAASLGTLVVVSRAIPGHSLLWAFIIALVLATMLLAVGVCVAIDKLDPRLWDFDDMEILYGRPVLNKVGA